MGGYLGIGGSSAKTDRGTQLGAQGGLWNVFNYGLPTGQAQQAAGTSTLGTAGSTLGQAQSYFSSLLKPGRTTAASLSAPATNAALAQNDASRGAAAELGTGRTGGTAAINRESGASTQKSIDDIINSTLQQGRQQGGAGLAQIGGEQTQLGEAQLSNALQLLGLSSNAVNAIMSNATDSRKTSYDINKDTQNQWFNAIGSLLEMGSKS